MVSKYLLADGYVEKGPKRRVTPPGDEKLKNPEYHRVRHTEHDPISTILKIASGATSLHDSGNGELDCR